MQQLQLYTEPFGNLACHVNIEMGIMQIRSLHSDFEKQEFQNIQNAKLSAMLVKPCL